MEIKKGNSNTKAKNKYNAKAYDNLHIVVYKGKKEVVREHASQLNESINAFVNRAINETMDRDNAKNEN